MRFLGIITIEILYLRDICGQWPLQQFTFIYFDKYLIPTKLKGGHSLLDLSDLIMKNSIVSELASLEFLQFFLNAIY